MKFSIITPNYNYAKFIGQTIESVVKQDYNNIEHIIVDDGSTDNSVEIIKNYQKKYPDKVILIQQVNSGQTAAINTGLRYATGDIIGWINSDDCYCENIFSFISNYFELNENVDLIFGDLEKINLDGQLISTKFYLPFNFKAGCFLGFGNLIANNSAFFRKFAIAKIGLLDETLSYVMDSHLWFEFGKRFVIKKVDRTFGRFRVHDLAKSNQKVKFKEELGPLLRQYYDYTLISKYIPFQVGRIMKYYYMFSRFLKIYILMRKNAI